jgi:aldehyde:ferredoxin oxidoreductase
MQGWAGKILDINLTNGSINTLPLDMEMARLFLGVVWERGCCGIWSDRK